MPATPHEGSRGEAGRSVDRLKSINSGKNEPIFMQLRKVLNFSNVLGLTLPKVYTNAMSLNHGDYVEVNLRDRNTIVVKKHGIPPKKITIND